MNGADIGQERNWVLAAYGLLLIAPGSGGVTALIGAVLAHVRLDGARGGLYESHYRNLILVFWVWLAVALVLLAFAFTGAAGLVVSLLAWPERNFPTGGFLLGTALWSLGGVLAGIWYYWRLLRGLIRALDDKPY
jgi:uncharacterized membrane protein